MKLVEFANGILSGKFHIRLILFLLIGIVLFFVNEKFILQNTGMIIIEKMMIVFGIILLICVFVYFGSILMSDYLDIKKNIEEESNSKNNMEDE